MGQRGSKSAGSGGCCQSGGQSSGSDTYTNTRCEDNTMCRNASYNLTHKIQALVTPIVLSRWSSMFLDEDGHRAHEFYVETRHQKKGPKDNTTGTNSFVKIDERELTPEGLVTYPISRLNADLPYILMESEQAEILKRKKLRPYNTRTTPLTTTNNQSPYLIDEMD